MPTSTFDSSTLKPTDLHTSNPKPFKSSHTIGSSSRATADHGFSVTNSYSIFPTPRPSTSPNTRYSTVLISLSIDRAHFSVFLFLWNLGKLFFFLNFGRIFFFSRSTPRYRLVHCRALYRGPYPLDHGFRYFPFTLQASFPTPHFHSLW